MMVFYSQFNTAPSRVTARTWNVKHKIRAIRLKRKESVDFKAHVLIIDCNVK